MEKRWPVVDKYKVILKALGKNGMPYIYASMPPKTANEEKPILNKWIIDKLRSGPQYFFGIEAVQGDATTGLDPRNQNEDLGDDAMLAGAYGIKNLKRILPNLIKWTQEPDENYARAGEMYTELVNQYNRYMGHVLMNIGGVLTTPKTVEQPGDVFDFVPKETKTRHGLTAKGIVHYTGMVARYAFV